MPTAALNVHYCGDWSGLKLEHAGIEMKKPLVGIWGNALLLLKNFAPPFFPLARAGGISRPCTSLPQAVADPMVANFEPGFPDLGEMPTEDGAGTGLWDEWLLAISLVAALVADFGREEAEGSGRAGRSPSRWQASRPERRGTALAGWCCAAPWVSLLAYCLEAGIDGFRRATSRPTIRCCCRCCCWARGRR